MVAIRPGAREVPVLKPADVRFGSEADICIAKRACLPQQADTCSAVGHVRKGQVILLTARS
jgi:hypothetical protein